MGQRIPGEEQQAPAAAEQGETSGPGGITDLLQNLTQGMAMLSEVITESGIDPALSERVQGVQAELDSIVETISQGGGAPQGGGAQPVPAEAGAGGVPQSPATR